MALFGAPIAHEDDPERAVRAALAIREWAEERRARGADRDHHRRGARLAGRAAGGGGGHGLRRRRQHRGPLQAAAPTNGILVDETTYRATERAIYLHEAEPVEAKGKAEPVPVSGSSRAARATGWTSAGRRTPLVGRRASSTSLAGALARARKERSPQLVTLVGVPGSARAASSRALPEVEADLELITWRQGRSLPYGEGMAFWGSAEMVKGQAGILETDSAEAAGAKLGRDRGLLEDAEGRVGRDAPAAAGRDRRRGGPRRKRPGEAFAAWRRFFEALAERGPLVLVFEDLHWADDGLLDFVDYLVDWAVEVPLLVVCTARPELVARRPGWGGGKANALTISLSALTDEETARLVHALLERAVLPAELQDEAARARRRQPSVRRGVRPDGRGARFLRRRGAATTRVPAGTRRRAARRPFGRGEGSRAGRRRDRKGLLGGARWLRSTDGSAGPSRRRSTCSNASSSFAVSGGPRSAARRSMHSSIWSFATSPTARSLVLSGPRSTASQPSGSSRSLRTEPRIAPRCWRITISRPSSFSDLRASTRRH